MTCCLSVQHAAVWSQRSICKMQSRQRMSGLACPSLCASVCRETPKGRCLALHSQRTPAAGLAVPEGKCTVACACMHAQHRHNMQLFQFWQVRSRCVGIIAISDASSRKCWHKAPTCSAVPQHHGSLFASTMTAARHHHHPVDGRKRHICDKP